jgi:hypothetical protein
MTNTLAIALGFNSVLAVVRRCGQAGFAAMGEGMAFYSRIPIRLRWLSRNFSLGLLLIGLTSCGGTAPAEPRQIVLKQSWEIESGDRVAGQLVTGSLGDISVRLEGIRLRAPFSGQVELASKGFHCIYFSTPEVPAYLFRYCGVRQPRLGPVQAGEAIGRSGNIHFATLRRQPDGAWAIVEPSDRVLERSLNQPSSGFRF